VSREIDIEHRERIRTQVEQNLCVEAGAGTGKTTALVARVASILTAPSVGGRPIDVDHIGVITFTDLAAAELMSRVREQLEDLGAEEALRDLHRAHVETIHAFCISMLRERPVEAGLDPQFGPMDDMQAGIDFDEAYAAWLEARLADGGEALALAIDRGFGLKQIRRLAEAVHLHRGLIPITPISVPDPDLALVASSIARFADQLDRICKHCNDDEDKGLLQVEAALAWAYEAAEKAALLDDDPAAFVRFLLFNPPRFRKDWGTKGNWGDDVDDQKELRTNLRHYGENMAAQMRTHALVGVLHECEGFALEYEESRRRRGVADFDDILLWARRMLRESREARDYFRRRFPVLLVDEFQDTDPVQAEIILTIASDDEPGANWLNMTPRPGGLTVVGDPKQSIYRFRRADISMYEEIRQGPLAGGDAELRQNFRTVPEVIAWLNDTFDELLTASSKIQPANLRLEAHRPSIASPELAVTMVRGEIEGTAAEMRAQEADILARTLTKVFRDQWPVFDRSLDDGAGDQRPVEAKDIAVLVRSWTEVDVFIRALRRAGIKALTSGGKLFFNRQEVRDLANILASLHDPLDQVALVAALRSQVFGCSDEEILLWKMSGGPIDYRWSKAVDPPERVKRSMGIMKRLHQRTQQVSLPVLVREVVDELRLVDIVLAGNGGVQGAANVMRLVEQARHFSATGSGGLRQFAAWLARQREEEQEGDARIAEKADDAVLVTTIHGSKGLEFPVVVLANIGTARKNRSEPIPDRDRGLLHVRIKNGDDEFTTPEWDTHAEHEALHADAEDVRLLYVAATRTRDHLIVPLLRAPKVSQKDEVEKSLLALIHPRLPWATGTHGRVKDGVLVIDAEHLPELPEDRELLDPMAEEIEVQRALDDRATWIANAERIRAEAGVALTIRRATDESAEREPDDDSTFDWGTPLIMSTKPGAEVGTALHAVMEVVDLANPGDITALVTSVCHDQALADQVADVTAMAQACLESDAVTRAIAADEAWREVPYMIAIDSGFESGRIDLLIREGDALTVIDWKSDSIGPDAANAGAESHRTQAEAYVRALETTTGMVVKEVIFVFARARAEASLSDFPDPTMR